jgi:hypothetical protein
MSVLTRLYVGQEHPSPIITGTAIFPDIQSAINYAVSSFLPSVIINISPGDYSSQAISLAENIGWILEGAVSGASLIGDITWFSSGGLTPLVPQSYLLIRNCAPKSITLADGYPAATNTIFIGENTAVLGNITATGIGNISVQLSGISTASSVIAGSNISSLVLGNINVPNSQVSLTNTQIHGDITIFQLVMAGCQQDGYNIKANSSIDLRNTIFTKPQTITFTGLSSGTLMIEDSSTDYHLAQSTFTIVNGIRKILYNGVIQTKSVEIAADITTSSTTFVDLDGITSTITTQVGSKLELYFSASVSNVSANTGIYFRFMVDGVAGRGGAERYINVPAVGVALSQAVTGLPGGFHTIKVQWRVGGGTGQIRPITAHDSESAALSIVESNV